MDIRIRTDWKAARYLQLCGNANQQESDAMKKSSRLPFDPETQEIVVRKSICTGEMTVGYVEKTNGKFHELMLVKNQQELTAFCKKLGVKEIRTIY